mgnify:CR=1 FL=1
MEQTAAVLLREIEARSGMEGPFLIAVDGRCASGKTTLAAYIQRQTGCQVVHMDDFFLRPEQRTEERLTEPGGNVDWERFREEVLLPLSRGEKALVRPYDCHAKKLGEPVTVMPDLVTVVEGSYSCHPRLWDFYHMHIFLSIDPAEQLRRIEKRNGKAALEVFRDKWIPLEERYFETFHIAQRCICLEFQT